MSSAEKIKEWFEKRQQESTQRPSKAFLLDIFKPSEGQTEEELEAEIHKKDTEQILKNSTVFYEKFLKFAENDFKAEPEEEEIEEEEDIFIAESSENAEKEEEKRLEKEMDKTTEMFKNYLKSCDNSNLALDEIDKALSRFNQGKTFVFDKFKISPIASFVTTWCYKLSALKTFFADSSSEEEEISDPENTSKSTLEEPKELKSLFGLNSQLNTTKTQTSTMLNFVVDAAEKTETDEPKQTVRKPMIIELD